MRVTGIAEQDLAIASESQFPLRDPGEHLARPPQQLVALRRVMREARTRQVDAVLREARRIEGRDRPARLTEKREKASPRHAVQALIERRLADGVVDDVHSAAIREAKRLRFEVALRVVDHL